MQFSSSISSVHSCSLRLKSGNRLLLALPDGGTMGRMSSGSCFISFRWKSDPGSPPPLSVDSPVARPCVPLEFSESLMPNFESSGEPLAVPLSRQAFLLGGKPSLKPLTWSLPSGDPAFSSFLFTVSCS